jgi:Ca-activated chloride channel family protein
MSSYQRLICASMLLASVGAVGNVRAADDSRAVALEINKANELLRKGDVDAAIGAYQKLQQDGPHRSDLSYDMAVAQYRKGDVTAAEHLFKSAAGSDNDALAAKARYNLGNCDYAAALKISKSDAATALKGLDRAITNYRSALDIESADADARTNLELAAKLRDKLRQQQKQQQQNQQQQQQQQNQQQQQSQQKQDQKQNKSDQQSQSKQQQQQQDKNNDHQQSQAEQQQKQSSADKQQPQQKSAQNNQQQNKDQKKDEQSQHNQSSSQQQQNEKIDSQKNQSQQSKSNAQEQAQPNKPEDKSSSAAEQQRQEQLKQQQQQQSQTSQRQSPQTLRQHQQKNGADEKPEPTEQQGKQAPKGKLAAATKQDKSKDAQNKQEAVDPDSATDSPMTRQEAEKMLQAIRDRDMLRRLQRQAVERDQHVPVDRDW